MRWFRPLTRSRPNQTASARKRPTSLFRRRQPARLRSLQIGAIPNRLVAGSGKPRKILRSARIADADSGRELPGYRLDQHRVAADSAERADQRGWYTA